jgi:hypothetical protein
MPFEPRGLNDELIQDLKAFLQTQNFPDLYMAYFWKNDIYANGFPDIYCLESKLIMMDKTNGISLPDVKCVAKWGGLRNQGRINGESVVLQPQTLHTAEGAPINLLGDEPLTPLLTLQNNITKGIGPTYFTKILRFGLPQEYGAIDTRCVRVFGRGDIAACRHHWLSLNARNDGYGWFIPKKQVGWPNEYGKWINILRYFACSLRNKCPHPAAFVAAGLRQSGVWACADVEMALFSYASQFT